jgi:hypothetical protein
VVGSQGGKEIVVERKGKLRFLALAQAGKFDLFRAESVALSVGDTVRITKNFRAGGTRFRNNELHTVTALEAGKVTLDSGDLGARGALHLDQGIVVTSHASQGKTVAQVIVSVPVESFSQANEAQFYVSMSRARKAMHLFTDSKVALREAVTRKSARLSPRAQALLIHWSLGSILVKGPKAEAFFERFCEQKVALVKADGKDVMRVTVALREGKGEE